MTDSRRSALRILHVVTLITPDGAYGGPVRVALNQAAALRERGHDVTIAAAASGFDTLPDTIDGTPAKLFPAVTAVPGIGFAGTMGKGMQKWLRREMAGFDVVHIHLARDFVTLPAARTARRHGVPYFAQTHGMIDTTDKLLARPLDLVWTRPALRHARSIFYLTQREATDLTAVGGSRTVLRELHNGVPFQESPSPGAPRVPEVLYLARLQARKRPEMFARMAVALIRERTEAQFALVGPDEGGRDAALRIVDDAQLQTRITFEGAVPPESTAARMTKASIYVLPSVDEPYPMSVLEAMSLGLPVVVTDTCGLAEIITETGSGIVVGPDVESLTDAVRSLLAEPLVASEMGARARRTVRDRLSMDSVADVLETSYRTIG